MEPLAKRSSLFEREQLVAQLFFSCPCQVLNQKDNSGYSLETECRAPEPCHEFQTTRLLLSHLGLLNTKALQVRKFHHFESLQLSAHLFFVLSLLFFSC